MTDTEKMLIQFGKKWKEACDEWYIDMEKKKKKRIMKWALKKLFHNH